MTAARLTSAGDRGTVHAMQALLLQQAETARLFDLSPLGSHAQRVRRSAAVEGTQLWLAVEGSQAWGCAQTLPVPGLPALSDLALFVAPSRRRQGIGSLLWQAVRAALAAEPGVSRLSAGVDDRQEPLARFLLHHRFFEEHVEWEMRRDSLDDLGEPAWPAAYRPATYARAAAMRHFIAIYDASFASMPWYQPFSPSEVAGTLDRPDDLLFATAGGAPAAVVWMRSEGTTGVIEPIGVMPAHRGRGVGRALLAAALLALRCRGAIAVR
ncbi:MAG: GNAT family N-acetyltransferase, partial [Anaerolineae bacterium]|nr:GNAT family N-acetyltransferase [Anaerolineae bacterium]